MRVLLYVEPFPIRNSFVHFLNIAKEFLNIIAQSISQSTNAPRRVYMYANKQTVDELHCTDQEIAKFIVLPVKEEVEYINSLNVDWDTNGIENWTTLINGGDIADKTEEIVESVYKRCPFDVIVNWGENYGVRQFCQKRNIINISMELGCTRKPFLDSVVFDPFGTNGNSIISKISINDLKRFIPLKSAYNNSLIDTFLYSETLDNIPFNQYLGFIDLNGLDSVFNKQNQPVCFFPLQLYDDANIIKFSSFKSPVDVLEKNLPFLIENNAVVIVKPHPAAKHRPAGLYSNREAYNYARKFGDRIVWIDENNTTENARLFSLSDFVVTVNSSVGFESLFFNSNLCVLGESIYKPKDLFPEINQLFDFNFDQKYYENIQILRKFILEAYLVHHKEAFAFNTFFSRIETLSSAYLEYSDNPAKVAEICFEAFGYANKIRHISDTVNGYGADTATQVRPCVQKHQKAIPTKDQDFRIKNLQDWGVFNTKNFDFIIFQQEMDSLSSEEIDTVIATYQSGEDATIIYENLLKKTGLFDEDFYLRENPDIIDSCYRSNPILHYIEHGENEGRQPCSFFRPSLVDKNFSFNPNGFPAALRFLRFADENRPLFDARLSIENTLTEKEEEALRNSDEILRRFNEKTTAASYAAVCHIYYADMVGTFITDLKKLPDSFDIFITVPYWGNKHIVEEIQKNFPKALILPVPNRGRDIGPFLMLLDTLIKQDYKAVVKLHSKKGFFIDKSFDPLMGKVWNKLFFDTLIPGSDGVQKILQFFSDNKNVGMIGPKCFYVKSSQYKTDDQIGFLNYLSKKIKYSYQEFNFVAGTMFWFNPNIFQLINDLKINFKCFPIEDGSNVDGMSHLLERAFGLLANACGFKISTIDFEQTEKIDEVIPIYINPNPTPEERKIEQTLQEFSKNLSLLPSQKNFRL